MHTMTLGQFGYLEKLLQNIRQSSLTDSFVTKINHDIDRPVQDARPTVGGQRSAPLPSERGGNVQRSGGTAVDLSGSTPAAVRASMVRTLVGPLNRSSDPAPALPLIRRPVAEDFAGYSAPHRARSVFERGSIGKLLMGPEPDPAGATHLNPFRTERGSRADLPFVKMERADGRPAPLGGYQTKVSKDAIDELNKAYADGASESGLFNVAARHRVRLSTLSVRNLINARDQLHRPGKFVPEEDRTPPPEPLRPGESMTDYVARMQGGRFEWAGPYTPSHPFGRNTDERLRRIVSPWVGYEEAERLSSAAQTLVPVLSAMQAVDDTRDGILSARFGDAAVSSASALASLFPGYRSAKGTLRVIDAPALQKAAGTARGAYDPIQAVRLEVEQGLARGAKVTLQSGRVRRRIVGTNEAGRLIDETGTEWPLPSGRQRLEILDFRPDASGVAAAIAKPRRSPEANATLPSVRPAGTSGLLGGPKFVARLGRADGRPGPSGSLDDGLRPQTAPATGELPFAGPGATRQYDPELLRDPGFADLRYDLAREARHRFGEEIIASLGFDPASRIAFQRLAWPSVAPAAVNRSVNGRELLTLRQMFRDDELVRNNLPLTKDMLKAQGNMADVLEAVGRQHPGEFARLREFEQMTIPYEELRLPRTNEPFQQPTAHGPGEFSVADWRGYPDDYVWRPTGPFRWLPPAEYGTQARLRENLNDRYRGSLNFKGLLYDIHEPNPVFLAGAVVDPGNKTLVEREVHQQLITPYWWRLARGTKRK